MSAKKKRLSSRRRVVNQNETFKADVTESTFIAQPHIPEENVESLNVDANLGSAQSETQHSPELSGNRRKLGSRRRNKAQDVQDSESSHRPTEEVEHKTRVEETITKQMSPTMQPKSQQVLSHGSEHDMITTHGEYLYSATLPADSSEVDSTTPKSEYLQEDLEVNEISSCKFEKTRQEGIDQSDIPHNEEVKESAHRVVISEMETLTVDQLLIDRSNFRELPEEKLFEVCSETEKEEKERDKDADFFRQVGNLKGNYLVSECPIESVAMRFSTTTETSAENIPPREDNESNVEQTLSSPDEQSEHFTHQAEDAENYVHEQEIKLTDMHEIDHPYKSVMHDATDISGIISANLIDQSEISDQSELTVRSPDDSPTNQDFSNPDEKWDEYHTKENNGEASEKNENDQFYDTKETQISDTERDDTALGLEYGIEGRVDHDVNVSAEHTGHLKAGLFSEMEASESSLQTLQSDIDAPFDSQPQQDDSDSHPIGNRRKLGSSRRNKGRQHVKDSAAESVHKPTEEVTDTTRDNEDLETTEMSLTTETAVQETSLETIMKGMDTFGNDHTEDVSDQVKENALVGIFNLTSSRSQWSSTVDEQTTDQSNVMLMPDAPNVCHVTEEENRERDEDKELFREDRNKDGHSEDAVNKLHDHEVKATENQEKPQIHHPSESVIHVATEISERISANLTDQYAISDIGQWELTVKSPDDSPTNQDILNPDDKQDEHYVKENVEASEKNEDDHVCDTKEPQISDTERNNTAVGLEYEIEGRVDHDVNVSAEHTGHEEKEVLLSDMETLQSKMDVHDDPQPEQDTTFSSVENRRKLGSSRRNKRHLHVEDSAESNHEHKEEVESSRDNEAFQSTQILLPNERTSQEGFSEGSEHDITSASEVCGDHHSEDALYKLYENEVKPTEIQEMPEIDHPSESVIHDEKDIALIISSNLFDQTSISDSHLSELTVKRPDDIPTNQHVSNPDDKQDEHHMKENIEASEKNEHDHVHDTKEPQICDTGLGLGYKIGGQVDHDVNVSAEHTGHEEKEVLLSEMETLQSKMNVHDDPQPEQNTTFGSVGNRRKLGSSRRNKRHLHVEDSAESNHEHKEEVESSRDNEAFQSTQILLPNERRSQEGFSEGSEHDITSVSEVCGDHHLEDALHKLHEHEVNTTKIQEMPQIDHTSESVIHDATDISRIISSNLIDKTGISDSHLSELTVKRPDDFPTNQHVSNPEYKQDEHHMEKNNIEASEKNEDDLVHDPKEPQISDTERNNTAVGLEYEIGGRVDHDVNVSAEHTGHEEKEGVLSEMETLQSKMNVHDDPQPEQDTTFGSVGNRRKLGSSRRNKRHLHVEDSAESNHEHKEEVESSRDNEAFQSAQILLPNERTSQEGFSEGSEHDITSVSEVCGDHHSEDALNKLYEHEVKPTEIQEMPIISLNLIDQTVISDIDQSELIVKSPDDSHNNQGLSNPDEKQDETHVQENIGEASEKNENDQFYDTKETQIGDTERDDTAVGLGHEIEGRVDHDVNVSAEHTGHLKAGLFPEMEESESSLQTLQSDIDAPFDSQPQQDDSDSHPIGNRRKLGSSRRNKGRKHVKDSAAESIPKPTEEVTDTTRDDEDLEPIETTADEEIRKMRSTVNDKEKSENMLEENILSQNMMDNNTSVTGDLGSSAGEDRFVQFNQDADNEETKLKNVQTDDSGIQSVSYHHDNVTVNSINTDVLEQDETKSLYADKEMNIQQNDTAAESTLVQIYGQDEDGGQSESPRKKDSEDQEISVSASNYKIDTLAPFDFGVEKNLLVEEKTNSDDSEKRSKQKKRKMGSTRRTQLNRKPEEHGVETKESKLSTEADMRGPNNKDVVGELMVVTAEISKDENPQPSLSPGYEEQQKPKQTVHETEQKLQSSDQQNIQSNMIADIGDSLLPGKSASHNEDDNPESERCTGIIGEGSVSLCELTQSTTNDDERPESGNVIHHQVLTSAEVPAVADLEIVKFVVREATAQTSEHNPDYLNAEAHENVEMKNASPSPSRRRKMGSTRRNLGSRAKREDLNQKQMADDEVTETNVGDVEAVSLLKSIEDELGLHIEQADSSSKQGNETQHSLKPLAHQTVEENLISHRRLAETESTPSDLPAISSNSPKHGVMSESAESGGRRRKMGSHRKSHGQQNYENQTTTSDRVTDTKQEGDVRSVTDESSIKTRGLDKISEVDQGDSLKEGEPSRPASKKTRDPATAVPHLYSEIRLGQESQQRFSLAGSSRGTDSRSNAYNVMMVGDSSVGKTSFMKRAQSGKFSLDIPASVGLDSCMWTVLVDGKSVMLQLWDTAGQERFHSITRQIFHKAHAFLLMYDTTSAQSFSAVSYWANCIQEGAAEDVTILLVGNKNDRADRQVQTQDAELLAKEYKCEYTECSAATGENVVQSLETVARLLSQKADMRKEATALHGEPQPRKSSGCC